jgi:Protein of unknown function (DUF4236)
VTFTFRKSVSAGPFRFNLSKSGIGVSAGVKGFRIGSGPNGHYIRGGVGGFQYHKTLNGKKTFNQRNVNSGAGKRRLRNFDGVDGIQFMEIESAEVAVLTDENLESIVSDVNEKLSKTRKSWICAVGIGLLAAAILAAAKLPFYFLVPPAMFGWFAGSWWDSYSRVAVFLYDFDKEHFSAYRSVFENFERLMSANKIWHVPNAGKVETLTQWKRNAGASVVVNRNAINLATTLPPVIRSNINVPMIPVGKQKLYFFPDHVMVMESNRIAAISYNSLALETELSNFIESEKVPTDANIVSETWKYPNKKGGPDKRYNHNRLIPVCLYETILFRSKSGLLEMISVSKCGPGHSFCESLADYGAHHKQPPSSRYLP